MFVQVIQGKVADAAAFQARSRQWSEQLRPGASGFLGSTGGVTADGTAVVMACFSDEGAAMANSGRPEQDAWWRETEQLFTDTPTFRNTTDVTEWGSADPTTAGFVQVMQGATSDRQRYEELSRTASEQIMQDLRPDVLCGRTAWFDGDEYVEFIYFTSEEEARKGERAMNEREWPSEMQEMVDLSGEVTYYDLTSPQISSSTSG